jgi:hypothetical protein
MTRRHRRRTNDRRIRTFAIAHGALLAERIAKKTRTE